MFYYKNFFSKLFIYLPRIKLVIWLFAFITSKMNFQTFPVLFFIILKEKSLISISAKPYFQYSFGYSSIIITYEFVLSVYVTSKVNSSVKNSVHQVGKHAIKAVSTSACPAVGQSDVSDSDIIDIIKLNDVTNGLEFKSKIDKNTTSIKTLFLGLSSLEILPNFNDVVSSDVLEFNNRQGFLKQVTRTIVDTNEQQTRNLTW